MAVDRINWPFLHSSNHASIVVTSALTFEEPIAQGLCHRERRKSRGSPARRLRFTATPRVVNKLTKLEMQGRRQDDRVRGPRAARRVMSAGRPLRGGFDWKSWLI